MNPNNSITEFSNQLLDACVEHRKQLAEKEVARLREALKPFLKIANGIPENWPEQCILRFDQRNDGSLYVNYYGVQEASDGITIKQWRDLAQSPEKTNEVARLREKVERQAQRQLFPRGSQQAPQSIKTSTPNSIRK